MFYVHLDVGFCIGMITRISKQKIPLCYFFKNVHQQTPSLNTFLDIKNEPILLIQEAGIQGFKDGSWVIIGRNDDFRRSDWPVPIFFHHTQPFKPQLIYFDDDMNEIKRESVNPNDIHSFSLLPRAGLGGSRFIEKILSKIIAGP